MTTLTPSKPALIHTLAQQLARRETRAYVNPYLAGILLGAVLFTRVSCLT